MLTKNFSDRANSVNSLNGTQRVFTLSSKSRGLLFPCSISFAATLRQGWTLYKAHELVQDCNAACRPPSAPQPGYTSNAVFNLGSVLLRPTTVTDLMTAKRM